MVLSDIRWNVAVVRKSAKWKLKTYIRVLWDHRRDHLEPLSSLVESETQAVKSVCASGFFVSHKTKDENVVVNVNPDELLNTLNADTSTTTPEEEQPIEKVMMEDYEVMGTIRIPKTGIEYPVLETVTKRSIEIAVGIAYGPGLNEVGNTIIFGHNYRNGLFFSNNKKLSNGDKIYITDKYGQKVTYEIYNMYQTDPSDASYFVRDTEGRREISLQTCTDDSSARIIIWAAEQEKTQQ